MVLTQEQYREATGKLVKPLFPPAESGAVQFAGCSYGIVHQQERANGERGAFVEVTLWVPEQRAEEVK
jgi:hypothetical protein